MNNTQTTKSERLIKKGDIVFLGEHVLGCGDCRDKEFVTKVVGGRKVALVNTDVPYGVALVESAQGFKAPLKNKVIESDHFQSDLDPKN